ncbi:MAG TPA: hypothetical protein VFS51_05170 [Gemmatimonadales bacterium]|nr:hypothetical protein [Gemmatimonadales bacterium]
MRVPNEGLRDVAASARPLGDDPTALYREQADQGLCAQEPREIVADAQLIDVCKDTLQWKREHY